MVLHKELLIFLRYKWEFCRRDPEVLRRWNELQALRIRTGSDQYKGKRPMGLPVTDEEWDLFENCDFPKIDPLISFDEIEKLKTKSMLGYLSAIVRLKNSFINSVQMISFSTGIDFDRRVEPLTALMRINFEKPVNPNLLKQEFNDIVDAFMQAKEFIAGGVVDPFDEKPNEGMSVKMRSRSQVPHIAKQYVKTVYGDMESTKFKEIIMNAVQYQGNVKLVPDDIKTSDFDNILKAGNLYYEFNGIEYVNRQGTVGRDVAKELFPDDCNTWDGKWESKNTRQVQLRKLYLKLVCGGWRSLVPGPKPRKRKREQLFCHNSS